jgi:adenylate cyclase
MQGHSEDINSLRERAGQQTLQLRIGIHWGDVVNTASCMEKACTPGHVLVSRDVRDAVEAARPGEFAFGPLSGLAVKGKLDELEVCWALGEFSRIGGPLRHD